MLPVKLTVGAGAEEPMSRVVVERTFQVAVATPRWAAVMLALPERELVLLGLVLALLSAARASPAEPRTGITAPTLTLTMRFRRTTFTAATPRAPATSWLVRVDLRQAVRPLGGIGAL